MRHFRLERRILRGGQKWRYLRSILRSIVVGIILIQQFWFVSTIRKIALQNNDGLPRFPVTGINSIAGHSPLRRPEDEGPHTNQMKNERASEFPKAQSNPVSSKNTAKKENNSLLSLHGQKFLVFRHVFTGQGAGNVISGLLATHLLGSEFNRTVCVDYPSFQSAFQYQNPHHASLCASVLQMAPTNATKTLKRNNYDPTGFSSECDLKKQLEDPEADILYYIGNTYPRWSQTIQVSSATGNFFHLWYAPAPSLLRILPWSLTSPLSTVVHLRQGDGDLDERAGIDNATLKVLGETLPSDTFLVTNHVSWYDFFRTHYGWSHPPWTQVQHSALHIAWEDRQLSSVSPSPPSKERRNLELWADWYALLNAETIYHTHSDFSKSAARWNTHSESWTIRGVKAPSGNMNRSASILASKLDLEQDFLDQGGVLLLSQRPSAELKYCNQTASAVSQEYKDSRLALALALAKRRQFRGFELQHKG